MNSLKDYQGNVISAAEAMALIERLPRPKKTEPKNPEPPSRISFSEGDFLTLEDLSCVDADGNVFESYDRLDVRKDIFRSGNAQVSRTPYAHAVHCEEMSLFLPSFALTCNIVARLYERRADAEIKRVLQQYKNKGNGDGWHAQNTIVRWVDNAGEILHYPSDGDFPSHGGREQVNKNAGKTSFPFSRQGFNNTSLEQALTLPNYKTFVQNLTGLEDPRILVKIGEYFSKPTQIWVPTNWNGTTSAWFGCFDSDFNLDANFNLSFASSARGVRRRSGERSEPGAGGAK